MSKKKVQPKVYVKDSSIIECGKGLFADKDIKKGNIIAEYKGRLLSPGEIPPSNRSNIYFNDEYILNCYNNDLASFANDAINFPKKSRYLMETLESNEPFYSKHENVIVNSSIKINDTLHRAFLIATCDIKKDDEIFCHYGFTYWYKREIKTLGFLYEDELALNFPDKVFEYPAFLAYVNEFYPNYTSYEVKPFRLNYDFIIHFNDGNHIVIVIERFSDKIHLVN